jgi:hypothetical protein
VVLEFVEVTHTNFTKITRVIFIHHDSVVVLTTRHTATSWVLAMFPNSTVTGGDVSTLLAVFVSARKERKKEKSEICQQVSKTKKREKRK